VAAAERRRGRRDNGLDATDWRAIEDLDPRVVDEVLDLLAARGIAAYVQPAVDVDPVTRSATLPSRPADRLFVDRQQVRAARDYLRGMYGAEPERPATDPLPPDDDPPGTGAGPSAQPAAADSGPGRRDPDGRVGHDSSRDPTRESGGAFGRDLDATFAGIVAGFDRQVDPTAATWPAAENLPTVAIGPEPPATTPGVAGPVDARDLTEPSLLDALDTFGTDLPGDEPPERFVPPPPPPLPRFSRQTVLGWVAILVGLILLVGRPDLLPTDRSTTMLLGFAMILGGAVALILRLRPGTDPDEERPPNDGAQV
jgi:hypothetical protein